MLLVPHTITSLRCPVQFINTQMNPPYSSARFLDTVFKTERNSCYAAYSMYLVYTEFILLGFIFWSTSKLLGVLWEQCYYFRLYTYITTNIRILFRGQYRKKSFASQSLQNHHVNVSLIYLHFCQKFSKLVWFLFWFEVSWKLKPIYFSFACCKSIQSFLTPNKVDHSDFIYKVNSQQIFSKLEKK